MLLIYSQESSWTQAEMEACYVASTALIQELDAAHQYVTAAPLQSISLATSVRIREGKRILTDGPFAETREQLGGFFLIDVPNLDVALEIAARIPSSKKGTVEVRPVHELAGLPENN